MCLYVIHDRVQLMAPGAAGHLGVSVHNGAVRVWQTELVPVTARLLSMVACHALDQEKKNRPASCEIVLSMVNLGTGQNGVNAL